MMKGQGSVALISRQAAEDMGLGIGKLKGARTTRGPERKGRGVETEKNIHTPER